MQVDSVLSKLDTVRTTTNYALDIALEISDENNPVLLWKNGKFLTSVTPRQGRVKFGKQYFSEGSNSFTLWLMDSEGRTSLIDSFTITFSSPRLNYLSKQVSQFYTPEKVLALTFDGGSSNRITHQILDTLLSRNVKSTMFLTGDFIRLYPEETRRIVADGHEVGNHSLSHPHLTRLEIDGSSTSRDYVNREFIINQLLKTDSLFYQTTQEKMAPVWRAPFGEQNRDILTWAAEAGFKHINWSAKSDSWDWVADTSSALYRSATEIYEHFMQLEVNSGLNGRILLMHLGSERQKDFPYTSLGRIIDELKSRGYKFLTIGQLLNPNSEHGIAAGR
jgi:peptidoglycan/xylan/chitin deacetylase (PgdA/CDA1 family)